MFSLQSSKGLFVRLHFWIQFLCKKKKITISDWYCNSMIHIRMCMSRQWWRILWMLENIHWLVFHQFARSYAVTHQCYHIHLVLTTNNAPLTIHILQGFQSFLLLAEKHFSNLLLFNLQLWGRKWPKEWFNTELCAVQAVLYNSSLHSLAGKSQPLHQITFLNCIKLRDIIRFFFFK